MPGMFSSSFQRLGAAAAARETYQTVISSNIANADTPHFKADKRNFSDFFKNKLSASQTDSLATTNPKHIQDTPSASLSLGVFNRSEDEQRMDGNTVDVEHEMAMLAENQLMYELNMKIIQGRLSGITNAIKDGGR
ncbi:MAG: flagellar basal body rod protein FlgB [Ghiorsea sp.]|nr:flagellar basal body rod protein FlgB [Ghiorsea sp.]